MVGRGNVKVASYCGGEVDCVPDSSLLSHPEPAWPAITEQIVIQQMAAQSDISTGGRGTMDLPTC